MADNGKYYYSFETGKEYFEAFPTVIEEVYPEPDGKLIAYKVRTVGEDDPGYEEALERYLLFEKGVRAYDEIPEWAVD